jgi:cellulose synthase/poly-beta-1,6-N-acetylglucosamine synthase-like glycosyltransferase
MTLLPGGVLGLVAGYLSLVTVAAWHAVLVRRTRTPLDPRVRHRFCVLIPAHNEERLIGSTLKSMAELDYPEPLVRVHVVADNCTDRTADVVRAHGFEAHEHNDADNAGKGPALQWLLGRLTGRGETYDAVLFVDADTIVDPQFLRVADALLSRGAAVIQAYYAVRDPGASPAIAFRAAALAARHYLRPLGRNELGGSAGLYGNGMVFRADVLQRHRWSGHLTEDLEVQLLLLLDGTKVTFAPEAIVEAEMPATTEAAGTQNERWERGRVDLARRFVPLLLRRAVRGGPSGRVAYADAAVDQLIPPFSVVAAGSAALTVISLARAWWRPPPGARRRAAGAVAITGAQVVYVLSALRMTRAPRSVYWSLLRAPQFAAWKVTLWLNVLLRRRDVTWIRTVRNDEGPLWS